MTPTGDDPSTAAAGISFPDADGGGDSEDGDFPGAHLLDPSEPGLPNPTSSSAAVLPHAVPAGGSVGGPVTSGNGGERRPLFQRLWTEEDEIVILRGFAEFTAARGTAFASHQYDTDPFYEDMRRRLQLDFSKSQLVEKLRRLKRKYRNCISRLRDSGDAFSFRSPHEQAIFEIARNIWRPANKHGRDPSADSDDEDAAAAAAATAVPGNTSPNGEVKSPSSGRQRRRRRSVEVATAPAPVIMVQPPPQPVQLPVSVPVKMEDSLPALTQTPMPVTVTMDGSEPLRLPVMSPKPGVVDAEKNSLTPLLKEMIRAVINVGVSPFGAKLPEPPLGLPMEGEKWRKQRILELEVYLRRIELLQDQVKTTLEELKSSTPGT
ncbi:hypothetical protein PR202_ga29039 [Eleusine coracana subsp. coracana]|uniref:Glabrous enhancer-binding protein-like DBD domain-containing protein n=1 Tax=Eleusine coracana subsp. coracana TaxID=191504 RepID=A0AAV5DKM1_ELECO|nr:hypothetical protein QOZ80_7AG0578830 [Eleusine coracana subsp. coracana]GJN10897.1 hypothetical protein PR202_ga29039 [Eleusine coracana subsp. coracana]